MNMEVEKDDGNLDENKYMNDNNKINLLFKMHNEGKDVCSECSENKYIICCNRCGNAVCSSIECSSLFPHYQNTIYVICDSCSTNIYGKMKLIDFSKLTLLKKKIKTRQTSSEEKISNTTKYHDYT